MSSIFKRDRINLFAELLDSSLSILNERKSLVFLVLSHVVQDVSSLDQVNLFRVFGDPFRGQDGGKAHLVSKDAEALPEGHGHFGRGNNFHVFDVFYGVQ